MSRTLTDFHLGNSNSNMQTLDKRISASTDQLDSIRGERERKIFCFWNIFGLKLKIFWLFFCIKVPSLVYCLSRWMNLIYIVQSRVDRKYLFRTQTAPFSWFYSAKIVYRDPPNHWGTLSPDQGCEGRSNMWVNRLCSGFVILSDMTSMLVSQFIRHNPTMWWWLS